MKSKQTERPTRNPLVDRALNFGTFDLKWLIKQ